MKRNIKVKLSLYISIVGLLLLVVGSSFAILQENVLSTQKEIIQVGAVKLALYEPANGITLNNLTSMNDAEGFAQTTSYSFSVSNVGDTNTEYTLTLNDIGTNSYNSLIKVGLEIDGKKAKSLILGDINGVIDENVVGVGETVNYILRLWYDTELVNMSTSLPAANDTSSYKLTIEAIQSLDKYSSSEGIYTTLGSAILRDHVVYADNISSPNVSGTGINFGSVSGPINGQGLYSTSVGTESSATSYYFRGGDYCTNPNITTSADCTTAGGNFYASYCTLAATTKTTCEATTGNVWYELNNWVFFAGKYWQIIRINEDGSIRLLYAGDSIEAKNADDNVGSSYFNNTKIIGGTTYTTYKDVTNVGYMFSSPVGKTIASNGSYTTTEAEAIGANANEIESEVKVTLEDWYERAIKGIITGTCTSTSYTTRKTCLDAGYFWTPGVATGTDYSSYIADVGYCNDRSKYGGNGYGISATFKANSGKNIATAISRLSSPQFMCNQSNDLFTVSNTSGNQMSVYPVGLLTSDEIVYFGGHFNLANYSYQLKTTTSYAYWIMTPYNYVISTSGLRITATGTLGSGSINLNLGVRPVISLKNDTSILRGNGAMDYPYIVATD